MGTRETELPGVGTKFTLDLATGEDLVIVEHRAGHFELARVDAEGDTKTLLQLQAREAGELGRILSRGNVSSEDKRKQMLFQEFGIEWISLEDDSPLIGATLQATGIRARTGANVIAVLRDEGSIASPPPETEFRSGDTLVVMGQRDQVDRFLKTFTALTPDA